MAGCVVHTYQPMSGLHRPVVVDPNAAVLAGVNVELSCANGGLLRGSDASGLCQTVAMLFENQGATVAVRIGAGDLDSDGAAAPDLRVELRARQVHEASHPWSWVAMVASFSLVPAITEFTFEQDVIVRDRTGFLLAEQTLRGRVMHGYGFGVWAGNKLLDLTVREPADEIVGDHADRALSQDLYRQLTQTVYDAHLQAQVLGALRAEAP